MGPESYDGQTGSYRCCIVHNKWLKIVHMQNLISNEKNLIETNKMSIKIVGLILYLQPCGLNFNSNLFPRANDTFENKINNKPIKA